MPIYMDVHIVPGVKAADVAEAHSRDLLHQHKHGCKCMTYWIDEQRETIFCLIEAPSKDAVVDMHNKAHGLIPNRIIEVNSTIVESFLGRIYDPEDAEITEKGLKIFNDRSFRVLLLTTIGDPILLQQKIGVEKSKELINLHNSIVRKNLIMYGGREAEHGGMGFIIPFSVANSALACAQAITKDMTGLDTELMGFRMAIHGGEPVENSSRLFGETIQLARYLCNIGKDSRVVVSSTIWDLISRDDIDAQGLSSLKRQEEELLRLLFSTLEENWQNPEFDTEDFCRAVAMSKSQLYRKSIGLTGLSPNILLKEFRLEKAREMMKKQRNIAQVTFDCGFNSPSYFTKCFKKKYGLLPMKYLELVDSKNI